MSASFLRPVGALSFAPKPLDAKSILKPPNPPGPPPPPAPPLIGLINRGTKRSRNCAATIDAISSVARMKDGTWRIPYRTAPMRIANGCISSPKSLLECWMCHADARQPFMQCGSGHTLCHECIEGIQRCPICKVLKPFDRNLELENMLFSCAYSGYGCTDTVLGLEKGIHQRNCLYQPLNCIVTRCLWRGGRRQFVQHLTVVHNICITDTPTHVSLGDIHTLTGTDVDVACRYFHPSQLCIVTAHLSLFLLIIHWVKASEQKLHLSVVNLTAWESYGSITTAYKAKLEWSDSTGDFGMNWIQKVDIPMLSLAWVNPNKISFNGTCDEGIDVSKLRVTISSL